MSQQHQLGTHATTVSGDDRHHTIVTYHKTQVVKASAEEIILNTGGWFTPTTKTRMNQASNQFDLGFHVYQKTHQWYVDFEGETIEFTDSTLTLKR